MENLDISNLTEEQKEFVNKFQILHGKLSILNNTMENVKTEISILLEELQTLRKQEKIIFKDGKTK